MQRTEIYPGTVHLAGCLDIEEQHALSDQCFELGNRPVGRYRPRLKNGSPMNLEMLCLGRHWNASNYQYETVRSDHDRKEVPALPEKLKNLAMRIAEQAGTALESDVCIINYYGAEGRLGLHQDNSEAQELLDAGVPIVSVSLGDTADFEVGGLRRWDRTRRVLLESGDAVVFGGGSRLRFHGISKVHGRTAPPGCGLDYGRINLTFRQSAA